MTEDLEKDIRDGDKVEQFLKDEAVLRAFQKVEDGYVARWKQATTRETREELWAKLSALTDVRTQLNATIGNRDIAKSKKEHQERTRLATARRGQ
jgi:hypothetical protein